MAEVSNCTGKRTQEIALKMYKRYLLESQNKFKKRTVCASSLPAGFLIDDIKKYEQNGAENAANSEPVASQDSYTRVKQLLGGVDGELEKGIVAQNDHISGRDGQLFSKKTLIKLNEKILPRYRRYALFWRTLFTSPRLQQSPISCHVYPGHGHLIFKREYSGNGTRSEPLYKTRSGYYEVLEVSPTATQAQIKTAYYKQSFMYHPDRNAGSDEATVRFSEISEAYTVLGNKALRKKYDRGLLSLSDLTATVRPSRDTSGGTGKQGASRRSVVGLDNRGGVFDFDKFFKSHYSEQLQRQRELKVRKEEILKKKRETMEDKTMDNIMEIGVGMLLILAIGIFLSIKG